MRYTDLELFGVYVAPLSLMLVAAWAVTWPLRRLGDRLGVARLVWHPSLFNTALYVIVLSLIVLIAGRS